MRSLDRKRPALPVFFVPVFGQRGDRAERPGSGPRGAVKRLLPLLFCAVALSVGLAGAGDGHPPTAGWDAVGAQANALARAYREAAPLSATALDGLPRQMDAAYALQRAYVRLLGEQLGPVAGYKAALTNPVQMRRFGLRQPLLGRLLQGTLRPDGVQLRRPLGAHPAIEGDLLVRVASRRINQARTPAEVLPTLAGWLPFLELVDLPFPADHRLTATELVAVNCATRGGVAGALVPMAGQDPGQLRELQVVLSKGGHEVATGRGRALMEDPLRAVLWLRDALRRQGVGLKPGDLLSLGSMTAMQPLTAGTYHASYRLHGKTVAEVALSVE